jgi:hypothetical protein
MDPTGDTAGTNFSKLKWPSDRYDQLRDPHTRHLLTIEPKTHTSGGID